MNRSMNLTWASTLWLAALLIGLAGCGQDTSATAPDTVESLLAELPPACAGMDEANLRMVLGLGSGATFMDASAYNTRPNMCVALVEDSGATVAVRLSIMLSGRGSSANKAAFSLAESRLSEELEAAGEAARVAGVGKQAVWRERIKSGKQVVSSLTVLGSDHVVLIDVDHANVWSREALQPKLVALYEDWQQAQP